MVKSWLPRRVLLLVLFLTGVSGAAWAGQAQARSDAWYQERAVVGVSSRLVASTGLDVPYRGLGLLESWQEPRWDGQDYNPFRFGKNDFVAVSREFSVWVSAKTGATIIRPKNTPGDRVGLATTSLTDAVGREFSVFVRYPASGFLDANSREFSVFVRPAGTPPGDAVSREFSVFVRPPSFGPLDANSREFSVFVRPAGLGLTDANSREFSVFVKPPATSPNDAVAREFSVFVREPSRTPVDASSREFSVFVLEPARNPVDAISREFSVWLPLPEIETTVVAAPPEIATEIPVRVAWTLVNNGRGPALAPWIDAVYLSNDDQPGQDTLLGRFPFPGRIDPGDSFQRAQDVTIPRQPQPGRKWLIVFADVDDNLQEADPNQANNWLAIPVLVTNSPLSDLVVEQIEAPSQAFFGEQVSARALVRNVGLGPTNNSQWVDRISLQRGQEVAVQADFGSVAYLEPGESYWADFRFTVPQGKVGTWSLHAAVDVRGQVNEADETNNTLDKQIELLKPPLPDLATSAVSGPLTATVGEALPAPVTWRVTNVGDSRTPPGQLPFHDGVYVRSNATGVVRYLGDVRRDDIVDVGGSYQASATGLLVPLDLVPGEYTLEVVADWREQVYEFGTRANNLAKASAPLQLFGTVSDLEPRIVAAPSEGASGETVVVRFEVKNYGPDPARGRWTDVVYVSPSDTFDENAVAVGFFSHDGPLSRDASYTVDAPVKLPDCREGQFYFFVKTDAGSNVPQGGFTQNDVAGPRPIQMNLKAPDLVVSSVQYQTSLTAGQALRVQWNVKNQGIGPTNVGNWMDRVYLSRDPVIGFDAIVLGDFPRVGGLGPGESYRRDEEVRIPPNVAGAYYILVRADVGLVVQECGRTENNLAAGPQATVSANSANLVSSALSAPEAIEVGQPIDVSWSVRNIGNTRTSANAWTDDCFISPFANSLVGAVRVGFVLHLGLLEPGESYLQEASGVVPYMFPGDYYIVARADAFGQVFEGGQTSDNLIAKRVTLKVADVNLTPTSISAPSEANSGQRMPVSFRVKNTGAARTWQESWIDKVVLSRDRVVDPTDIVVGSIPHSGGLAPGEEYLASSDVPIPPGLTGTWYVGAVVDWTNAVPETEEFDNDDQFTAVNLTLPPPVDLVVADVTTPAEGFVGERAAISYRVENRGQSDAKGTWVDLVYLSQDSVWDVDDTLVARFPREQVVVSGDSYTQNVEVPLPSVLPGNYRVLVRSNVGRSLRESDFTNNALASSSLLAVDIPVLPLGEQRTFAGEPGLDRSFKTPVASGLTVKLSSEAEDLNASTDVRVRLGKAVTRSAFDYRSQRLYDNKNFATVPETSEGTYFSLFGLQALGSSQVTVAASEVPFSIESFGPKEIGNDGRVTLTLQGGRFRGVTNATLSRNGVNIPARKINVLDGASMKVQFELNKAELGTYTLGLERPGQKVEAAEPVTVETARPAKMDVVVTGTTQPRLRTTMTALASIRNTGNVDAEYVHVQGIFYENVKMGWDRPTDSLPPRSLDPAADWVFNDPSARYDGEATACEFLVRDWEPGGTRICQLNVRGFTLGKKSAFILAHPQTEEQFVGHLRAKQEAWRKAYLALPEGPPEGLGEFMLDPETWWNERATHYIAAGYFETGGLSRAAGGDDSCPHGEKIDRACMIECSTAWNDCKAARRPIEDCRKENWWCQEKCNEVCCKPEDKCKESNLGWSTMRFNPKSGLNVQEWGGGGSCGGSGSGGGGACIDPRVPVDPNSKSGPQGVLGPQFIGSNNLLPYTVEFENEPSAQAAVAQIVIEDPLDPLIDERTVRIATMRLGDTVIEVPPNSASFATRLDLKSDPGLFVNVDARIDVARRTVRWVFTAIDKATGDLPVDTFRGLLLPEDGSGRGQGSVGLVLGKRKGGTGTIIENEATITFEQELPLRTNAWQNTSDDVAPSTQALPIVGANGATFTVRWEGADDLGGCGIDSYDVYVAKDDGPFELWLDRFTGTSAEFSGEPGPKYSFYTRARDRVGNLEAAPAQADTSIDTKQFGPDRSLAPFIRSFEPTEIKAGSESFKLRVTGSRFQAGITCLWNGEQRPVTWVSATECLVDVSSTLLEQPGEVTIVLVNPANRGQSEKRSTPKTFRIVP